MNILIVGGSGQIGSAVARLAPQRYSVCTLTKSQLDIRRASDVASAVAHSGAEWIVNCAAFTAVDQAEDEPERARLCNDTAVKNLMYAAVATGCRLIQLSTDFVFDGKSSRSYIPSDIPNPLNVYGSTKLAGELNALNGSPDSIVLRTAWVHAAEGSNFVLTMLRLMQERNSINVVDDQIGTPTWASSVALTIWGLIDSRSPGGIYHWTDGGVASWYDFAVAIHDEARNRGLLAKAVSVIPISTAHYPTRAVRPQFSVLNTEGTRSIVGLESCHWRHNLGKMLDELRTS